MGGPIVLVEGKWGGKWMEVQVHECRWSAGQRQVQNGNGGPQQSPLITRPPLLRLRPKFQICTRPSMDFWPFGRRGLAEGTVGKRGPEVRKAGREGEVSEAKGATAVTSGSGPVLAARKERRAAGWRRGQGGGRRPELEPGQWATDWESLAADTWTDGPERGFGGIKGGKGANIMRGLDMQRSQFRGESKAGARRPEQHIGRSSFLLPSLFLHFNIAAN